MMSQHEMGSGPPEPSTLPAVSVVVPTHNRPDELRRAISAILNQSFSGDIEIIVVFDQCEPFELDLALPDRRRLAHLTNSRRRGLPGARNTGMLAATGELIAFCDDDDEWLPNKLRDQVALFADQPIARVVGCGIVLDLDGRLICRDTPRQPVTVDDLVRHRVMQLHSSTLLARRAAVLEEIGLFDEDIPGGYYEDYDWLLRAGRIAPIPIAQSLGVRVSWMTGSLFSRRWEIIANAAAYLLVKHPEFASSPVGAARLQGQIAFFQVAMGRRRDGCGWAIKALRNSRREKRAYLALAVAARLISPGWVVRVANGRGRGL